MKLTTFLSILALSACASTVTVSAQPRPGAFTTLTTTGTITDGGVLLVNGFGTSIFSGSGTGTELVQIRNTSTSTTAVSQLDLGNNATPTILSLRTFSSTTASSGYVSAGAAAVVSSAANGLRLVAVNGPMQFWNTGGATVAGSVEADGGWLVDGIASLTSLGLGTLNARMLGAGYNAISPYAAMNTSGIQMNDGGSVMLTGLDQTGFHARTWPTSAAAANAIVANGDYIRLSTSIRAAKHDIEPIEVPDARRTVMGLQAVLYQSAIDADQRQWAGFIADDVEHVNPILVVYGIDGRLQSVTYDRVAAYLLPVIQHQQRRIEALEQARRR